MAPTTLTFGVLLFMAVLLAGLGARSFALARRDARVRARLQEVTTTADELDPGLLRDRDLSSMPPLNRMLGQLGFARWLERLILQADVDMNVGSLVLLMLTLALGGVLITVSVLHRGGLALPAALILGVVPILVLYRKKTSRRNKIERQLPDALDLITGGLRAGMAFTGALQMVAEESPDPLAKEFTIVFEEQRLGSDLDESMLKMLSRVESRELSLFVTAVRLQRETGGNLAEILEGAANVIRDRFRILGDIRTITAHARMTGMVLAVMPPVMAGIIWFMQPDYLKVLARDPVGPYLIAVAAGLQILGYFVIRKIVSIKV